MATPKITQQLRNQIAANNTAETGSHSQGLSDQFRQQIKTNAKALPGDIFGQLLGMGGYENSQPSSQSKSEDMTPGQEFILPKSTKRAEIQHQERKPAIAAGINYHAEIARGSELANKRESRELKMQIEQIMEELKRLVDSSDKVLQMAYADITVASTPAIVGKYHTNFFAFLLIVIRQARQKVEDSGAWLSVAKSKGGKKSYQMQSKKNGTSFSMSSERSTATQTG